MPRFSVVIPTYNRSAALRKTVESVLRQTYDDFEIIVVDDGSTDDTKSVINALDDARIRYFWMPNSGGPATPRNKGIDEAAAEWVCFLDSDDLWYSDKLKTVDRAIIENLSIDVVSNDEIQHFTLSEKKRILHHGPLSKDFYRDMLLFGNRCSTSALTVRKEFLDRYCLRFNTSPDFVIVEDYDLWLRMALNGANFLFLDKPLGEYLIDEGNISANIPRLRKNRMRLLHDHVFELQTFEPDRDALWHRIRASITAADAVSDMMEFRWSPAILNLAYSMLTSPRGTIDYFLSRFRKFCEIR